MSYINDALRKAQRERERGYGDFGGIDTAGPGGSGRLGKRWIVPVGALILFLAAGVLIAFWFLLQSDPPVRKSPPSPVAETAAPEAAKIRSAPGMAEATGRAEAAVSGKESGHAAPPSPTVSATVPGDDGTTEERDAEARYGEALLAQRNGDLRKAEALYRKALIHDPGHVRALNNLGVVYLAQGKRGKAVAALGRAVVLKRDYADPYYNLACLYARTNEIEESLWYLKVAATLDGNVIDWVKKDADMRKVAASPGFKKLMEGRKN